MFYVDIIYNHFHMFSHYQRWKENSYFVTKMFTYAGCLSFDLGQYDGRSIIPPWYDYQAFQ
jgi:hypothetical protein